jgi:hypothetical protein
MDQTIDYYRLLETRVDKAYRRALVGQRAIGAPLPGRHADHRRKRSLSSAGWSMK